MTTPYATTATASNAPNAARNTVESSNVLVLSLLGVGLSLFLIGGFLSYLAFRKYRQRGGLYNYEGSPIRVSRGSQGSRGSRGNRGSLERQESRGSSGSRGSRDSRGSRGSRGNQGSGFDSFDYDDDDQ